MTRTISKVNERALRGFYAAAERRQRRREQRNFAIAWLGIISAFAWPVAAYLWIA